MSFIRSITRIEISVKLQSLFLSLSEISLLYSATLVFGMHPSAAPGLSLFLFVFSFASCYKHITSISSFLMQRERTW